MDALKKKGINKNIIRNSFDDPELEAEEQYAKENGGISPKQKILPELVQKISEAFVNRKATLGKVFKTSKADRKARSRGVSGCSAKKDGNRFDYGLDCIDLAYDKNVIDDDSSTDSNAEYDEYADYMFEYSDCEIRSVVQDYLLNGSKIDALNSLEKFRITSDAKFRMLKDLIQLSLEAVDGGGIELGAQLLAEIRSQKWINMITVMEVIDEVVESLGELAIDSPKIVEAMSVFVAKLVELDSITYEAVENLAEKKQKKIQEGNNFSKGDAQNLQNTITKRCYDDALTFAKNRTLLQGKCIPAGGHQSLEVLSAQFKMILKEFLQSNDKNIVCTRVNELKVPHFNHEFVYQTGILALEKMHDSVMTRLSELLKQMYDNGLISESCLQTGFIKLYDSLSDLYYDLPAAYALARRWVDKSVNANFLSNELAAKCPTRVRSRNVSEGPDGKLICMDEEETNDENNYINKSKNCNEVEGVL